MCSCGRGAAMPYINTIISCRIPFRTWFRARIRTAGSAGEGWAWAIRWNYRQRRDESFASTADVVDMSCGAFARIRKRDWATFAGRGSNEQGKEGASAWVTEGPAAAGAAISCGTNHCRTTGRGCRSGADKSAVSVGESGSMEAECPVCGRGSTEAGLGGGTRCRRQRTPCAAGFQRRRRQVRGLDLPAHAGTGVAEALRRGPVRLEPGRSPAFSANHSWCLCSGATSRRVSKDCFGKTARAVPEQVMDHLLDCHSLCGRANGQALQGGVFDHLPGRS